MTSKEIESNASVLVLAGSETTATLLSGAVYYLCKSPQALQKLKEEIRERFPKEDDISLTVLPQLKYLSACVDETLRIYPPVAATMPRLCPAGGAMVCGKFVPGGTSVGVNQYAANRSSSNFSRPDEFIPERWLGDARFETDSRAAMQPFALGSRNCIGRK